ncbi:MAG: phosphate acyltransferase PlsX [Flavobacteriales bacterium]|nr:phosphate acyltransferase PlsX [Flavobacteriales bacterium]
MMRIGLDIMGSDHGPVVPVRAAVMAAQELGEDSRLVLIGDPEIIHDQLLKLGASPNDFDIVASSDDITMHDSATKALQAKPRSSIAVGFGLLQKGLIDAFASTGNTGAMMVGAMFSVKPIAGVLRPCISTLVPKEDGSYGILLDVGANADCKPEVLVQFGLLGAMLAKHVYHIEDPRVCLLNIGEEEKKGNANVVAAYQLMQNDPRFRFVGNVEGRDLFNTKADVMVCDGFTGNIVLKAVEGFHDLLEKRGVQEPFLEQFNYENYGGLPILGVNGNVIIGHGISNDVTIKNMVLFTREVVNSKLNDRIREVLK